MWNYGGMEFTSESDDFYQHIFNGCYAVLLFIVVVFFLIYGVEVFFKLRGEFLKETKVCTIISPVPEPQPTEMKPRIRLSLNREFKRICWTETERWTLGPWTSRSCTSRAWA
uniref:Uncharacterized protein n=1 Tax=Bombyx mori TaxID=7091 RepID=A0A8R2MAR5_BOMMO|nr:uncharacterized protein LOC119631158 [Bombyx mori]